MSEHELSAQIAPATAAPTPAGAVERRVLLHLLAEIDGDTDALAALVGEYLNDAPRLLDSLAHGIATQDVTTIGRAAHTLKSTSASFGATALSALCAELSRQAHGGLPADAAEQAVRIAAEFVRVQAVLAGASAAPDSPIDVAELLRRIG